VIVKRNTGSTVRALIGRQLGGHYQTWLDSGGAFAAIWNAALLAVLALGMIVGSVCAS